MEVKTIVAIILLSAYIISLILVFWLTKRHADQKVQQFKNLKKAIQAANAHKNKTESSLKKLTSEQSKQRNILAAITQRVEQQKEKFKTVNSETKELQELQRNAQAISIQVENGRNSIAELKNSILDYRRARSEAESTLHRVQSDLDLYSRVQGFAEFGHFELPEYLFETSERFSAEIKLVRNNQKDMIKSGAATSTKGHPQITGIESIDKKIIEGQIKMIIRAFNIECDLLIGKVSPSNFERTLSRIEKVANDLEKLAASLRCGISSSYIKSKYEECGLQYQYTLKKKEEQEEQKLIREQMREEARAEKEYREALAAAEKEESLYRDLLEKARNELNQATFEERSIAEAKIAQLEEQLAEAESKEQRAKSLAEQTRRGHVYVISNIGSFGENVYKIGMTRRLDPMDRVKELGDASVPFSFDVHAIIFTEDAPSMENALHKKFRHNRVNAVNLRKEFFRVPLGKIREAVSEIEGSDIDFKTTISADEYHETCRLRESEF